jgi:hypothetical protein
MIEHEREIVIRPVETRQIEPLLISGLGQAVRITAHSIRIRLLDLTIPWQDAIDLTLRAIESTRRVNAFQAVAVAAAG